ncbi:hypothetical protein HanHA300_Chr04g0155421 [Helianthus annuus]|nr:hypothetical protein HanHA300_Chr04g0155421 [Helianthus annuus]
MGSGPFPSSTTSTRPGPFAGLPVPPQNVGGGGGPVSNGPPMFGPGGMQGGPQYPPRPSAGPQHSPPTMSSPAGPFTGQPTPYSGSLPDQPPRGPPAFSAQSPGMPPPQASLFGAQAQPWQMQPRQNVPPPPILGSGQPPRMFGMQPPLPNQQSMATISPAMGAGGSAVTGPSKIDPNQIPQPIPNPSVLLHETRQGNQANPPPPATSEFIVRDTGNCSPRYMRCTINQIGCTSDILTTSGMQLALLVQPLALPHPSEEPIQVMHEILFFLLINCYIILYYIIYIIKEGVLGIIPKTQPLFIYLWKNYKFCPLFLYHFSGGVLFNEC